MSESYYHYNLSKYDLDLIQRTILLIRQGLPTKIISYKVGMTRSFVDTVKFWSRRNTED